MRVVFLTPLRAEKIHGNYWRLVAPLIAGVDGDTVEVPEGFETDFASVPRLPLAYLLAGNTAHRAAVLHDFLYAIRAGREYADAVFAAAMKAEKVPAWRRWLMRAGVAIGGASRYAEHAPPDPVIEGQAW